MQQKDIALAYAALGIEIFPCTLKKVPIPKKGFKAATCDLDIVSTWWDKHPDALIGAVNNDVVVVDIDDYGLDEGEQVLMENIKQGVLQNLGTLTPMRVITPSGGTHLYFKGNGQSRRIKQIAQVDVLGVGGYVILPDQKTYKTNGGTIPWEIIQTVPVFPEEAFEVLREELKPVSDLLKQCIQIRKAEGQLISHKKKDSPKKEKKVSKKKEKESVGHEVLDRALIGEEMLQELLDAVEDYRTDAPKDRTAVGSVCRETDAIIFDIPKDIYKTTTKTFEKVDPMYPLLEDGPLRFNAGSLNTDAVMMMFHNYHIQCALGEWMGLDVPMKTNNRTLMHSLLPGHRDLNKSMGVRWNSEGSHLLVKDFSNFFGDDHKQNDYNIVRLYACMRYNTNVPRLNGPEFITWFMRMLVDSGIVIVDHLKKKYWCSTDRLTAGQRQTAESFILLDAIKQMYSGFDGSIPFADKFSSAWAGIPPASVRRHKKFLLEKGFWNHVGDVDCSAGRNKNGFFLTKLYEVATVRENRPLLTEEEKEKIIQKKKEREEQQAVKITEAIEVSKGTQAERDEDRVKASNPDLGTMVSLVVDEKHQQTIRYFLEDSGMDGLEPPSELMMIPLWISEGYKDIDIDQTSTYFMDGISLEIIDGEEEKILMAFGTSPPIKKMAEELAEEEDNILEKDDDICFVVATGLDKEHYDLDELTERFNEYTGGVVSFTHINKTYAHIDTLVNALEGRMAFEE